MLLELLEVLLLRLVLDRLFTCVLAFVEFPLWERVLEADGFTSLDLLREALGLPLVVAPLFPLGRVLPTTGFPFEVLVLLAPGRLLLTTGLPLAVLPRSTTGRVLVVTGRPLEVLVSLDGRVFTTLSPRLPTLGRVLILFSRFPTSL